jgi:hypothetical protein
MVDIAKVGFSADTSPLKTAADDLDAFKAKAAQTGEQLDKLNESAAKSSDAVTKSAASVQAAGQQLGATATVVDRFLRQLCAGIPRAIPEGDRGRHQGDAGSGRADRRDRGGDAAHRADLSAIRRWCEASVGRNLGVIRRGRALVRYLVELCRRARYHLRQHG